MTSEFTFAHPQLLWLLLVLPPALALFFWWSARVRRKLMARFIDARLLPGLIAGVSIQRARIRAALLIAATVCLILALARPQWGFDWQEVRQRGLDIVVAIDTSKSMLAEDIAPNRLARAKLAALDLMQQAKSDRLGLVAFAGNAFLQCPLTIDESAFRQTVESLDVNIIPESGTALGEAIDTALTAFKEDANYKVLVLFTDGEAHDPGALDAAKQAANAGLRIFTIGIGSTEGELLRVPRPDGQSDYVRDAQGNVVKSRLNEALLQQIAGVANGFYLPLRGAQAMDTLYQQGLAPLPKTGSQERQVRRAREQYHWPLVLAILLLAIETVLPERSRSRRRKATEADVSLRPALTALLLLALPLPAAASASSAARLYQEGKFQESMDEYVRQIDRVVEKNGDPKLLAQVKQMYEEGKTEEAAGLYLDHLEKSLAGTTRLQFNAGAAAYRAGKMDEAALHFLLAAMDPDWKLQEKAFYNLGNARFQLGQQAANPQETISQWEGAIESYNAALALDPLDADAQFNLDLVKEKLEELKKQQQQQQDEQQQQPQDQQQQQQQQEQDPQNDQNQQQQSPSANQEHAPDSSPQEQQDSASRNQQERSQDATQDQQQAQGSPEGQTDENNPEEQAAAAAYAAGEMTPEQAERLLDAQKDSEKVLPVKPETKPSRGQRSLKDW